MNILFLGHSLIEFFDWQRKFPEHQVANLGVAGESVEGLLARIDGVCAKHPTADVIFLMTGLNNIAMEDYDFLGSYASILEKLQTAYPAARIYLLSILPVRVEFIANMLIQQINLHLRDLAAETGAEYIDLYPLFIDPEDHPAENCFTADGVHLSPEGYRRWADSLKI
jgi:lysophospholipase L1-like esterase